MVVLDGARAAERARHALHMVLKDQDGGGIADRMETVFISQGAQ
jgi:hypothetical protein